MTTRTRYFVITSLVVLGGGLGTALVAYYAGFPMSAVGRRGGPEELRFVSRNASVVAYANVAALMNSELRRKVHAAVPMSENGQREFQDETGINIETDLEYVIGFISPETESNGVPSGGGPHGFNGGGMVLARGVFDSGKIEALMREHGAHVESYKGKRLIVAGLHMGDSADTQPAPTGAKDGFALAFVEPGLAAVGSASLVRASIDNQATGQNATANDDLMTRVRSLEGGTAWAVGRFDAILAQARRLPANVASQIPPITWFSINSHINGGISGLVKAETRDEESANNLRDVVRGFMALAKLQAGSKSEYQTMMQSLELGGSGKTVVLKFMVPSEVFDVIGKATKGLSAKPGH